MVSNIPSSSANILNLYLCVPFNLVDINIGGAWQSATNQVVIPLSGKYYVVVDVATCSDYYMQFDLYVNGIKSAISRYLPSSRVRAFAAATARGQSGIMQLTSGDILYLGATQPATCYYSDATTFSGIFLGS